MKNYHRNEQIEVKLRFFSIGSPSPQRRKNVVEIALSTTYPDLQLERKQQPFSGHANENVCVSLRTSTNCY